jgi:hypothetical protein
MESGTVIERKGSLATAIAFETDDDVREGSQA